MLQVITVIKGLVFRVSRLESVVSVNSGTQHRPLNAMYSPYHRSCGQNYRLLRLV